MIRSAGATKILFIFFFLSVICLVILLNPFYVLAHSCVGISFEKLRYYCEALMIVMACYEADGSYIYNNLLFPQTFRAPLR